MEKKLINLTIDNIPVTVPQGTTILEAARAAGIKIPSLCFLKDINEIGACRICVVEVKGARSLWPPASTLSTRAWWFIPTPSVSATPVA